MSNTALSSGSRGYDSILGSSGSNGHYISANGSERNHDSNVDVITRDLGQTRISNSGPRNNSRVNVYSGPGPSHNPQGMKPIAKDELPYKAQKFAERPSTMVLDTATGKKFTIEANYFRVHFEGELLVYQYDIKFLTRKNMEMRKSQFTSKAFWYAYRRSKESGRIIFPDKHLLAYNGVNMLWSLKKLGFEEGEYKVHFQCDDNKEYEMVIKFATVTVLKPNSQDIKDKMTLVTVLDEVLTARLTCLYEEYSRYFHKEGKAMFYTPKDRKNRQFVVELGGGLEAWTGLHGAIKPNLQAGLLLNVDLSHSIFCKQEMNLVKFYCEIVNNVPFDQGNTRLMKELERSCLNYEQRKRLDIALKGHTLVYNPPGGREKVFKYSSIAQRATSAHTFVTKESGQTLSIEEYFTRIKGQPLRFRYLPCVCLNKTKNLWAPMEFVYTDNVVHKLKGKIPDRQLRILVQRTAFDPVKRKEILLEMAAVGGKDNERNPCYLAEQDRYMENFGTSVDRRLLKVNATLLPPPTLSFGQGIEFTDREHTGMWDLKNGNSLKKIRSEVKTIVPCLIFLTPEKDNKRNQYEDNNVQPFGILMEVLHNFGMNIPYGPNARVVERFDYTRQPWSTLVDWMREFKRMVKEQTKDEKAIPLAMFVFPYKCTTRRQRGDYFSEYSMVKYICDVTTGVYCQGILSQTYKSMAGNPITCSTAINVAIKILGKLGANLYTIVQNPETEAWGQITNPEEPTLVLGIDVTHPGEQDRAEGNYSANSVACVVGNVDFELMQFEASVRAQNIGQERTLYIKDEIMGRLIAFEKNTGKRPAHIVVYRDGVSESQFQENLYEEKKAIEEACNEVEKGYRPTLSYLIISKRHHTRFFPLDQEDTYGKAFNLKPGTLVETDITTKDYFDFYLISHQGPLGTSRPTHYYVLWDDWKPSPTFWQTITFSLTHSYVRCPKSISQPAPVMYAHLAAKRAKDYLMSHTNVFADQLKKMTEYENFVHLRDHMQKHSDLKGMIFV